MIRSTTVTTISRFTCNGDSYDFFRTEDPSFCRAVRKQALLEVGLTIRLLRNKIGCDELSYGNLLLSLPEEKFESIKFVLR